MFNNDDPSNYPDGDVRVISADKQAHKLIGWTAHEVIGIAVVNNYSFLPWYKKMFRKRFWRSLFTRE